MCIVFHECDFQLHKGLLSKILIHYITYTVSKYSKYYFGTLTCHASEAIIHFSFFKKNKSADLKNPNVQPSVYSLWQGFSKTAKTLLFLTYTVFMRR